MRTNNYHGNIGSISSGTMRPEDLIPTFITALEGMRPLHREHRKLVREIETRMGAEGYFDTDDACEDLDALFTALDSYAPPYFYFGAHEGDGSDYGYWLCTEAMEDSVRDGSALQVPDLADVPTDYAGEIFQVSDHGNVTLYVRSGNGRVREVWSIV